MKPVVWTISLLIANSLPAATNTVVPAHVGSVEHRKALLNYIPENPFATSRSAARQGYVPTNTLAFREYALDLMLARANEINVKWGLGLPSPLTTDHVTGVGAVPKIGGVRGAITISNRFSLDFENGNLLDFRDRLYWSGSWRDDLSPPPIPALTTNGQMRSPLTIDDTYNRAFLGQDSRNNAYHQKMLELTKMTNLLSKEDALRIAQDAFHKLGFIEKKLYLRERPEVNQFTYSPEGQNITYPLPLYHVGWQHQEREGFEPVTMEVSGITKTVVDYFNVAAVDIVVPLPTNYFQMLGVPPESRLWGKQFGYDPINTGDFQTFARDFLLRKANWLNQQWKLGFPRSVTTNDLNRFQATPYTNAFMVSAQITNRFYLQIGDGMIQIFQDDQQISDAFTGSKEKMTALLKQKNQLTKSRALVLAREALTQISLDEKKLQLPKPRVTQVREAFPDEEKLRDLPFYHIQWKWTDEEEEYAIMAMQISGITRKITMFVNSSTNTPRFALPTDYPNILGLK